MKITKIRIKNLFGIKELEIDGKDKEISGDNATGKSSVIDAIKYALQNKSDRKFIIRKGEEEGEIFIETDSGLSVNRKKRTNKADYKMIKDGGRTENSEAFLREIFTELQLNPVEFISMDEKDQNRIILDMVEFEWDINWIKEQFGEIVPQIDYEQNILCVLRDIQTDGGYYYNFRQDKNREAKNKQAMVEEIAGKLPKDYNAAKWEGVKLGDLFKKIEVIRNKNSQIEKAQSVIENRDNKVRALKADFEIDKGAIEKETDSNRNRLNNDIKDLQAKIKEYEIELSSLEEKKIDKVKIAEKTYEANIAEFEAVVKEYQEFADKKVEPTFELQLEADTAEKMKAFLNEYNTMINHKGKVETLNVESEELTKKIEKARSLPGEILAKTEIPIKGLTIEEGIPLINGLPISNLSEGERLNLCVDVATKNPRSLSMLLLDGVELLSEKNRESLYSNLKEKGVQFISTRTTNDEEMKVVEL